MVQRREDSFAEPEAASRLRLLPHALFLLWLAACCLVQVGKGAQVDIGDLWMVTLPVTVSLFLLIWPFMFLGLHPVVGFGVGIAAMVWLVRFVIQRRERAVTAVIAVALIACTFEANRTDGALKLAFAMSRSHFEDALELIPVGTASHEGNIGLYEVDSWGVNEEDGCAYFSVEGLLEDLWTRTQYLVHKPAGRELANHVFVHYEVDLGSGWWFVVFDD